MRDFTYENQGAYTYLVYTLGDDEAIDSMSLGMITNNSIPGLADTMFMQMNTKKYIKYNISSRIPASQFFSGAVSRKRLLGVFTGIVNAMLSAEEYMIDVGTILLDLDYIYADVSTCDTVLVCLPVMDVKQEHTDPGSFFKNMMFHTRFDQTENCDHVTKIINFLNRSCLFSLSEFRNLLDELRDQKTEKPDTARQPEPKKPDGVFTDARPRSSAFHSQQQSPDQNQAGSKIQEPVPASPAAGFVPGMQIPQAASGNQDQTAVENDGKGMSLFYLLRHYDKENASIYKAQKEERKLQKASKETIKKRDKVKKERMGRRNSAPAIPGQGIPPVPGTPAIPGQGMPPASGAPAIPGQGMPPVPGASPNPAPSISVPTVMPISPAVGGNVQGQMDFGNTVFIGDMEDQDGATVMMGMGQDRSVQPVSPYLLRRRNNERIPVNKELFRLGRNQEFNDYAVLGNDFVGNSHCHILIKGEEYFVVDDNSKNHTLVDGVMVMPGSEVKLTHGQILTLADEEFEFRLS